MAWAFDTIQWRTAPDQQRQVVFGHVDDGTAEARFVPFMHAARLLFKALLDVSPVFTDAALSVPDSCKTA